MEGFGNLLRWLIEHWKSWGIPTKVGSTLATVASLLVLWKKWKDWRQAKADSRVDARVIRALQDRNLWPRPRPFTGAGDLLVRSAEIAKTLSLDCDVVIESLERLEARARVRNAGGTLDNPAPYWHILHR